MVSAPSCCPGTRAVLSWGFLLCLGWTVFLLCALAAYKSLSVKVHPAKSYASHQRQGPVTIAADPYQSEKKIRTAFDVKGMEKLGLLPINIIVSNAGPDAISVNGSTIALLDPENQSFEPIPAEEVVEMILRQKSGRRKTLGRFPMPRGGKEKDAFEIQTDFIRKSLKRGRVKPRSTSWGFVFFQRPVKESALVGYKIYIPDVENSRINEKLLYFDIELKGP